MNIGQANSIPLALILEKLGCKPASEKGPRAMYLSPVRSERTPSFHVHHGKNLWYDFGLSKGGSTIQLICCYLERQNEAHTVSDALRWIATMAGMTPVIRPISDFPGIKKDPTLVLTRASKLHHPALLKYVASRRITLSVAMTHLSQVLLHNKDTGKNFFAIGLQNEDGGYEVRNQFFKGCVGSKSISFIRGKSRDQDAIHFFEGMMDFTAALSYKNLTHFEEDAIVLNSLSCLKLATPYIKSYGYRVAYTWLDNDESGEKGTQSLAQFFRTEANLQHRPMNDIYHPHKDVNAWHINKHLMRL